MDPILSRRKTIFTIMGLVGMIFTKRLLAFDKQNSGDTSATADSISLENLSDNTSKTLLVLMSFHHKNTEKIANEIAKVLNARITSPQEICIEELSRYDLIGFGSGIYDQKHHQSILDFVDKIPNNTPKSVFIYSTSGVSRKTCLKHSIDDPHTEIREKLQNKGCKIIDEFNCAGWNTNSFLKLFGGINKGKPNVEDLKRAKEFAENLQY